MTDQWEAFEDVCDGQLVRHPEDVKGTMFGCPGLRYAGGPFYSFAKADEVAVKLPAPRVAELVADGRGAPCAPNPDRPMREWVFLSGLDEDALTPYVEEARAFLVSLAGPS